MKRTRRSPIPLVQKLEEYRQIMGYIVAHGGYAIDAVKALGLQTALHPFRVFAKEQGFILKHYALAWRKYGNWLTVPGEYRAEGKARYIVPAICLLCNGQYELNLINAKTGKSKSCLSCGLKGRRSIQVRNESTGEVYGSIMNWTNQIGKRRMYQKLRLLITSNSTVEVDGIMYSIHIPNN